VATNDLTVCIFTWEFLCEGQVSEQFSKVSEAKKSWRSSCVSFSMFCHVTLCENNLVFRYVTLKLSSLFTNAYTGHSLSTRHRLQGLLLILLPFTPSDKALRIKCLLLGSVVWFWSDLWRSSFLTRCRVVRFVRVILAERYVFIWHE
jgi:hypothetical protein